MGAKDLTTQTPQTGDADVAGDGRPSPADERVAKKRKKQKALATVAANGNGHGTAANVGSEAEPVHGNGTGAKAAERDVAHANGNGHAKHPAAAVIAEDPVEEAVQDDEPEGDHELGLIEDLDAADDALATAPAGGGRRARRRAAKEAKQAEPNLGRRARKRAAAADAGPQLRRRARKRAEVALRNTPAARRNTLVATAARVAAAAAEAEAQEAPAAKKPKLVGRIARCVVVLVAICMIPASVYALVVTQGPVATLTHEDAVYMSQQLIVADQRVRKQLVRLRPLHTSPALARTRESALTARSLALELGDQGGREARALTRALTLESSWLDAVGSVLSNPRSPLRDELVGRDATLRSALLALPSTDGLRRKGGSQNLRDFSKSRTKARKKR